MIISRAPVRKHYAALLLPALVGTGLPAQAVFDYLVSDFTKDPTVVVSSGAINRRVGGLGNCWDAVITLNVYVFVLYADAATGWTNANAEDAIDAIEAIIADVTVTNQNANGYWGNARYAAPTAPDVIAIGGKAYKREIIKISMEVVG